MAHHLGAAHAAKRSQRSDQVHRLQDVGLALRIVAQQQMETRRKIDVEPSVISEISKPQMRQVHAFPCHKTNREGTAK